MVLEYIREKDERTGTVIEGLGIDDFNKKWEAYLQSLSSKKDIKNTKKSVNKKAIKKKATKKNK